jgi:hypothetical protein
LTFISLPNTAIRLSRPHRVFPYSITLIRHISNHQERLLFHFQARSGIRLVEHQTNLVEDLLKEHDSGQATLKKQKRIFVFVALSGVVFLGVIVLGFLTSLIGSGGGEQFPKVYFLLIASILGALVNQSFRGSEDNVSKGPSLLVLYLAWKCAIASVFAMIVNLIFISGVIRAC